jgi:hypothetical protein
MADGLTRLPRALGGTCVVKSATRQKDGTLLTENSLFKVTASSGLEKTRSIQTLRSGLGQRVSRTIDDHQKHTRAVAGTRSARWWARAS